MKVDAKREAKVEAHAVADLTMKAGDCCEGCQMNRGKRGCEGRVRGYMSMELEDEECEALSSRQLQGSAGCSIRNVSEGAIVMRLKR